MKLKKREEEEEEEEEETEYNIMNLSNQCRQ